MTNEPSKDNLKAILNALKHEQVAVREQAIKRLQIYANLVGGEAEKGTLTNAEAANAWSRARNRFLQNSRIVAALLIAIEDTSPRVRAAAALLLGKSRMPEAQEALIQHLRNDPVNHVRMMCVSVLECTLNSPKKIDGYIFALNDPHYQVVYPACQALGKLGDRQAVEPLRAVLTHSSWDVRFSACEALVHLHAVDYHVVHLLEELNQAPEAERHNQVVRSANNIIAEYRQGMQRALTSQEVLDLAYRNMQ